MSPFRSVPFRVFGRRPTKNTFFHVFEMSAESKVCGGTNVKERHVMSCHELLSIEIEGDGCWEFGSSFRCWRGYVDTWTCEGYVIRSYVRRVTAVVIGVEEWSRLSLEMDARRNSCLVDAWTKVVSVVIVDRGQA